MNALNILLFSIFLVVAFFVGSLPSGFLIGKIRGDDVTKTGSGNIGATNVARTGRNKFEKIFLFALVFVLDGGKAFLVLHILGAFFEDVFLLNLLAIAILLGNITPFSFFGAHRGKGVATSSGAMLALAPPIFLFGGIALFIVMLYVERYVSVASVSAVAFVCTLTLLFFHDALPFALVAAIVVYIRHRENFLRIEKKEEPRTRFPWEKKKITP